MRQRNLLKALVFFLLCPMHAEGTASRLVVVSGATRGVGLGICRQVLAQESEAEVVVTARSLPQAQAVAAELGDRAHAVQCDVTDANSCDAAASKIRALGGQKLLALVNNAGFAADLPWTPPPWPATAAADTMDVNLVGAQQLTSSLMPLLQQSQDGRVIFVSSGGGRINLKRMDEARRAELLAPTITWPDIQRLASVFVREYETAAASQTDELLLPFLSPSGFWLQAYGFSKACLGSYCQVLARAQPTIMCVTCSPGWVATDMSASYNGDATMRSIDEGGDIPAWLSRGERSTLQTSSFYMPDRSIVDWTAD